MAKKFFYNRVYNTRRIIINVVIISLCVIGIILCFVLTSNFQATKKAESSGSLIIKPEVIVEVNDKIEKEMFFSKIENVDLDKVDVKYSDEFNNSKTGTYDVTLVIEEEKYNTKLLVVDTKKPELELRSVSIKEGQTYKYQDFVATCKDNSSGDCTIAFYSNGVDENGNKIDYSSYKKSGVYTIKIVATDPSGNATVKDTTLTITKDNTSTDTPVEVKPTNCKYGTNEYDLNTFTMAVDVSSNGCAISLDLYNDKDITKEITALMNVETTKIKKQVENLNLVGTLAMKRTTVAIPNKSGNGIVGYELQMVVTLTNNDSTEVIVDYKVDKDGNRVYTKNYYQLEK